MDILDILTSNREAPQRVLQFKDVSVASASWPQGEGSKEEEEEKKMKEEKEEETLTSYALDDIPPHTINKNATSADMTPVKPDNNNKAAPDTSPAAWKTYPATPDIFAPLSATTTPSVKQALLPEEDQEAAAYEED